MFELYRCRWGRCVDLDIFLTSNEKEAANQDNDERENLYEIIPHGFSIITVSDGIRHL